MKSISFDRAANFYDETRGHPAGIGEQIARTLSGRLPARARLLEIGIGTGRIAWPLTTQELEIYGIDLSIPMMQRLRTNGLNSNTYPGLAQADATCLPFARQSFDAVIAVHILHLIPNWQDALLEARRVIKPSGEFLLGYDWYPPDTPRSRFRKTWHQIALRMSPGYGHVGPRQFDEVKQMLLESGADIERWEAASWSIVFKPSLEINHLADRVFSSTWEMPPEAMASSLEEIRTWAEEQFGSLETEFTLPCKFIWESFRWKT